MYQSLLDSFTEEYKPQTPTEHTLIERIANTKTRLNRFQAVESNLFELARERAGGIDNVIRSFELDHELAADVSSILLGHLSQPEDINVELFNELNNINDLDKVSGYSYVLTHLPELRNALFRECREYNEDINRLIGGRAHSKKQYPRQKFKVIFYNSDGPIVPTQAKTDEELDESGYKVSAADIVAYIVEQLNKIKRKTIISQVLEDHKRRAQLLTDSAMPETDVMGNLMRYQTSLHRQFS